MSGLFYNLGRRIGQAAVPVIRQSKWIWDGLTGNEEEALRAESAMGTALAGELRTAGEPVKDPEVSQQVNDLCRRLAAGVRGPRRAFHGEVIRADFPNAIALPGGFIFVSQTLVNLCERRPDELAFVIGHEMAHVIRGHAWDRMINQTALRAASVVAPRAGPLGVWLQQKGMQLLRNAHDRKCEGEADELGLRLAAAAGFNPAGAIALLQRVEGLGPDPAAIGQYFSSHPSAPDRIARLEPLCRQLASRQP